MMGREVEFLEDFRKEHDQINNRGNDDQVQFIESLGPDPEVVPTDRPHILW